GHRRLAGAARIAQRQRKALAIIGGDGARIAVLAAGRGDAPALRLGAAARIGIEAFAIAEGSRQGGVGLAGEVAHVLGLFARIGVIVEIDLLAGAHLLAGGEVGLEI